MRIFMYSKTCFERPLVMENGRKSRVAAQSKVDSLEWFLVTFTMFGSECYTVNTLKLKLFKNTKFGIRPNAFDNIRIFMASNGLDFLFLVTFTMFGKSVRLVEEF